MVAAGMMRLLRRRTPTISFFLYSSIRFLSSSTHNTGKRTGLYGFDALKTANGFRRFVDDAIERSGELVAYISQMPSSIEIVRAMDEISNTMVFKELCRHTHPSREFIDEATDASIRMNDYLHFLNTNTHLYNAVKKAEKGDNMNIEAVKVAHSLRVDFEKGGIHLCEGKMDRIYQLNTEIAQLGREFNENIMTDPGYVDILPASRIPKRVQHLAKLNSRYDKKYLRPGHPTKENGLEIKTDPDTLTTILRWVSDEEVRKNAYITGNSSPRSNLVVLDKIIAARHELAEIMGYRTYTDFAINLNMAKTPKVVSSFLHELSKTVRHKTDEEFKKISDFKSRTCTGSSAKLEPWDETYYTGIIKSSAYDVDPAIVASYFPLSQCIEGLRILVESLFGIRFQSTPLAPGESWHPDVIKMSLYHSEEGDLGYLYLDLYSRKDKYPSCAHFAIKGGRRLSDTEYQLPVVALVCNFAASRGSSSSIPVLLNHWELEVLFHEFGHALHSLLSRTDYQHFSGTRVVLDLAETPSNIFEYFAWDYRVLKRFAKHYSTGEVIPEKLVDALNGARSMFSATELQRQIFYSMIDQTIFCETMPSILNTTTLIGDLQKQHTSFGYVEGTHWHTRFNHLINYGAGYYSYLYARCFASTIWQEVCHEDPLSFSTGSAIRNFLKHGGAKEPAVLLKELGGDSILRCHDSGGIVPDITSLCKELRI